MELTRSYLWDKAKHLSGLKRTADGAATTPIPLIITHGGHTFYVQILLSASSKQCIISRWTRSESSCMLHLASLQNTLRNSLQHGAARCWSLRSQNGSQEKHHICQIQSQLHLPFSWPSTDAAKHSFRNTHRSTSEDEACCMLTNSRNSEILWINQKRQGK